VAVRFGTFVPQGWRMDLAEIADPIEKYEAMTNVAKVADSLPGFDSIWVYDHFHTVPVPTQETTFEAWTITAALTRDTQRVNVGQMVTCLGYRNPALLAKMASTVDVMSHGRLYCGIGAGWYEHEWKAYGYGFPETRQRMRAFREGTEIMYKMWTEDEPSFQGELYSIDKPINQPKGARKPHPALWIGGSGEQVTLKLVAKYADACNINAEPDEIKRKLGVLRDHCAAVGRDYATITKSHSVQVFPIQPGDDPEKATEKARAQWGSTLDQFRSGTFVGTPDEITAYLQQYVDIGIDYFILVTSRLAYDQTPLHLFADQIIPRFQ
jgi:F420-dependent oxidoreductase-like protein